MKKGNLSALMALRLTRLEAARVEVAARVLGVTASAYLRLAAIERCTRDLARLREGQAEQEMPVHGRISAEG